MSSADESMITIHVSNGSKTFDFTVQPCDTIQSIKQKISELTKVRANNILLLLNCAFMDPLVTLSEYEIEDGATLMFEIKLCGPKPVDFDWSKMGVPVAPKKNKLGGVKKVTEL